MRLENRAQTWEKMAMNASFAACGFLRQGIASLLLAVFVCLGLIPAGFMPEFSTDGRPVIKICSGIEDKTVTQDDNGQPVHQNVEIPCAFALNAAGTPVIQAVTLVPPVFGIPSFHARLAIIVSRSFQSVHTPRAPPVA